MSWVGDVGGGGRGLWYLGSLTCLHRCSLLLSITQKPLFPVLQGDKWPVKGGEEHIGWGVGACNRDELLVKGKAGWG